MSSKFVRASKKKSKARLGLSGPSGSGKTESALRVARGMAGADGRIAVLDTEYGSASLYSDRHNFDVIEIRAPFSVDKYIDGIKAAEEEGYDVLIIDSLTHAWAGEGGILEEVDRRQTAGSNKMVAWQWGTKAQNALTHAILNSKVHVIGTFRAKPGYAIEQNNGRTEVRKVGMESVQRDGFEFEFTTVLMLGMDHFAACTTTGKNRSPLFTDARQLSVQDGLDLMAWLEQGADVTPEAPAGPSHADAKAAADAAKTRGWTIAQLKTVLADSGAAKITELQTEAIPAFIAAVAAAPPNNNKQENANGV